MAPSYHSAPTARDRDRLRQQQLEALGWRFHRIWSTDWFLRRPAEVRRTLDAFGEALRLDENPDMQPVPEEVAVDAVASAPEPSTVPQPSTTALPSRGPRPGLAPRADIGDYLASELNEMVRWVLSDGRLHTNEEIVTEVTRALGFRRKGTRIVAAIERAIHVVRP